MEKLTGAHPDEVQLQVSFGYAHNNLGEALIAWAARPRRWTNSIEGRRSSGRWQTHTPTARLPDRPDFRQAGMSAMLRKLGRPAEALKLEQASLDMAQRLGESNPQPALLPTVLRRLALSFDQLGDTAAAVGCPRRR